MWESNPPGTLLTPHTGFEDQEAHQLPNYPHIDEVKKGALIAKPTGLGANIFASVYGKVAEITEDRIIIEPAAEQPDAFEPIDVPEGASKLDMVKAHDIHLLYWFARFLKI